MPQLTTMKGMSLSNIDIKSNCLEVYFVCKWATVEQTSTTSGEEVKEGL